MFDISCSKSNGYMLFNRAIYPSFYFLFSRAVLNACKVTNEAGLNGESNHHTQGFKVFELIPQLFKKELIPAREPIVMLVLFVLLMVWYHKEPTKAVLQGT